MRAALTVIVPTYNRRHVLQRSISCYLELARTWPVLLVDDGSRDGTADWVAGLGLAVLRTAHHGLPAARNAGLGAARTPWILFGEDDVLMPPDLPARLLAWSARLPTAAALAPRLLDTAAWDLPATIPELDGQILDPTRLLGRFGTGMAAPRPLPTLHACALVDRAAALRIGGYDTSFGGSHFREESDFYARLWRSGSSSWLVPDCWAAHVRHRLGGGCRSAADLAGLVRNRWSYLANDLRYITRHHRMWRRWGGSAGSGRLAANAAGALLRNLARQAGRALCG